MKSCQDTKRYEYNVNCDYRAHLKNLLLRRKEKFIQKRKEFCNHYDIPFHTVPDHEINQHIREHLEYDTADFSCKCKTKEYHDKTGPLLDKSYFVMRDFTTNPADEQRSPEDWRRRRKLETLERTFVPPDKDSDGYHLIRNMVKSGQMDTPTPSFIATNENKVDADLYDTRDYSDRQVELYFKHWETNFATARDWKCSFVREPTDKPFIPDNSARFGSYSRTPAQDYAKKLRIPPTPHELSVYAARREKERRAHGY